ncbi:ArnT family glycosyltransferase [Frankia sp. Cas4]|uniref:ArnT family glycosyltransferase n=1 Tax=Frankia sp. Cas4 TaxID=3073927 RepID=UPI002AD31A0A|nr:phospholipid carrier-dependent glycosyltransferase [Frankia sp. Cas4]
MTTTTTTTTATATATATLPVADPDGIDVVGSGTRDRLIFGDRMSTARARIAGWLFAHWRSLALLTLLLVACGLVHGINLDGWPGRINDDEGTYAAQAYAMQYRGQIAHYTYWYDHPFGGWLFIAVYTTVTNAFERASSAVTAARECMLVVHLVSCALIYLLARRLAFRRAFAGLAVLLFSLAPLAVWYQRLAFLDNIAVLWVVAALVCAASPRRSVGSAIASGVFMAFAFWSKETSLMLLPGVYFLLRTNRDPRNWRFVRGNFLGFLTAICGIYVLYAVAKNELFEGADHVSLIRAIKWQLFERTASGSLLQAGSGTQGMAGLWLHLDPYLLGAGVLAAVPALCVRRLRMVAALLLIQVVFMFRDGYMPYAYVTAMLPFAALCTAGMLDVTLPRVTRGPQAVRASLFRGAAGPTPGVIRGSNAAASRRRIAAARTARVAVVVCVVIVGLVALPGRWAPTLRTALTADDSRPSRDAARWYIENVPNGNTVVTDDNIWTDLVIAGKKPDPIWFYKLDLDPAVRGKLTNGWQDVDYFVLGKLMPSTLHDLPLVAEGLQHSVVVKSFGSDGQITIRKVIKSGCPVEVTASPSC